jgi:hypothetical protein
MSYSRNKNALKRVQKILDDMLKAPEGEDISFVSTSPVKLSYQLHEAFDVADTYMEYVQYRPLKKLFKIRVRSDRVVCERKGKPVDAKAILEQQLSKMTIDNVEDILGVIGAATKHKASEMYFPKAVLEDDELSKLYKWTSISGYYIINNYDVGITITKVNPGELAYEPAGLSTNQS